MTWAIYLGDVDIGAKYGLWVETERDAHSGPRVTYPVTAVPGLMGGVLAADPTTEVRQLGLAGGIAPPGTPSLTAMRASFDALKTLLYGQLLKVVKDDNVNPPREIDGVCTNCTITPSGHALLSLGGRFEMHLLCPVATWRDVMGQTVSFNATPQQIPLGDAPVGGLVRIAAPTWSADVVTPTLTYYAASKVATWSATWSLTLTSANQYLEINLTRGTAVEVDTSGGSAVVTDAMQHLSAGDFRSLDPTDGNRLSGIYPYLGVSASSGDPVGMWLGHRRWL